MNNLQVFSNPEFSGVRVTMDENGMPWLAASDVANALGYANPRKAILDHVDEEDKTILSYETEGGTQNMPFVNESGLYSLILSSKLPSAKRFKRWVTSEVLPSIRRNGEYSAIKSIGGRPDGAPDYVRMKEQIEQFILACMTDDIILRKKQEQITRVANNAGKLRLSIERLMQMEVSVEQKEYERLYAVRERK
jgi:prophage antirepressor-like protein